MGSVSGEVAHAAIQFPWIKGGLYSGLKFTRLRLSNYDCLNFFIDMSLVVLSVAKRVFVRNVYTGVYRICLFNS